MRMRITFAFLLVLSLTAALVGPAGAITDGHVDGDDHPMVGALLKSPQRNGEPGVYPTCTGTLISEDVFLTAAHCFFGTRDVEVSFDPVITPDTEGLPGTMIVNPAYRNSTEHDMAVVLLDDPVSIEPAELPEEGYLDEQTLTRSTKFTLVGYGILRPVNEEGPGGHVFEQTGERLWANSTFRTLTDNALHLTQKAADEDGGGCHGDSGGPVFWGSGSGETDLLVGTIITGDTYCKTKVVTARTDSAAARDFLDEYVDLD